MPTPRYRIEYRTDTTATIVSYGLAQLEPLARQLAAEGRRGELVVVDEGTGRVIIRWPIDEVPLAPTGRA